ncbi:MAG: GTP cyclohydrolase [Flavobacteriaceae bacterium]
MVTIEEAVSKRDIKTFAKFPFSLYKGSPYWVPPLIKEEMNSFDKEKNPAFKTSDTWFLLAYKGGKLVGRALAIINKLEVEQQQIKKIRFGWFDFVDDKQVSKALLDKVESLGRAHGMDQMEGPMGFSNLDKVGVLVDGFDYIGTMVTWYNHPYYQEHYEHLGLERGKEYVENIVPLANADPSNFKRINDLIKKRYQLRELNVTRKDQLETMIDAMFGLLDLTYQRLDSYTPISKEQRQHLKKRFIDFVNPEYIKFVVDKDDRLIAFAVVLPSYAHALQKANGKLFPFGIWHLLQARRKSKSVLFYLIGVHPDYQKKGVTAIIFNEYYETFLRYGVETGIRTPELEDNTAARQIWKHMTNIVHKRRRTYRKHF